MVEITLFGRPSFVLKNQPETAIFITNKEQALFIYIMMQPGPCSRGTLATLLWGDSVQANAQNNLRNALSHLRKQFEGYLVSDRSMVTFDRSKPHRIDVFDFEALAKPNAPLAEQKKLLSLYRGAFLAEFVVSRAPDFEEWASAERERLKNLYVNHLQIVVQQCLELNDYQSGLIYVDQLLNECPWLEVTHQLKMQLLTYTGQRYKALEFYESFQQKYEQEFGVAPNDHLQTLYDQIQSELFLEQEINSIPSPDDLWEKATTSEMSYDYHQDRYYLHEMPSLDLFYGREQEIADLIDLLVTKQSRLAAITGIGGQGKSTLAAQLCQHQAVLDHFEWIAWQPLVNAPPLSAVVERLIRFFYGQQPEKMPDTFNDQMTLLFTQFQQARCLLIFDNAESILNLAERGYQQGYEDYGGFIQRMGQTQHQSALLITSRELPSEIGRLARDTNLVSSFSLSGIEASVGQQIFQTQQISVSETAIETLTSRYSGNPLALKLISGTIQDLFFGDVEAFLAENVFIYGDIQDILEQQTARLSEVEVAILYWLAIERVVVTTTTLWEDMYNLQDRRALLEGLNTLKRRSLLQFSSNGFSLQNVVMEYLSKQLIANVCEEISSGQPHYLTQFSLMKAQSKDYVRESQIRIFLRPIVERLTAQFGKSGVEGQLRALLVKLKGQTPRISGYVAGNILNLFVYLEVNLSGYDFSNLAVWQAYLQDVELINVDFSGADLTGSHFLTALYQTMYLDYSADGAYLATAQLRSSVNLWRTADLTLVRSFERGDIVRGSLAFSPDGRWLAGSGENYTVYVWDYEAGVTEHILAGHTGDSPALIFSPDSRLLVSGSRDGTIRIWDVGSGEMVALLGGDLSAIFSLVFNLDGTELMSGSVDGQIRIWSMADKTRLETLTQHIGTIFALALSPDGTQLASAGEDGLIHIWNLATRTIDFTLSGHKNVIYALAFSADGQKLVSRGYDKLILIWDLANKRILATLPTGAVMGFALAIHPDGQQIASCDEAYAIRLWDLTTRDLIYSQKSPKLYETHQFVFTPDSQAIIAADLNAYFQVWNIQEASYRIVKPKVEADAVLPYLAISNDGSTLFSTSGSDVQIWDYPEMTLRNIWPMPTTTLRRIAIDSKSEKLAVLGEQNTILIGDIRLRYIEHRLEAYTNENTRLAFSPDGTRLASFCYDNTVRIWDVASGLCLHTIQTVQIDGTTICDILFSQDSEFIITGQIDAICVWDTNTGRLVRQFDSFDHQAGVCPIAIDNQENVVVSVARDFTMPILDYHSGKVIRILEGHGSVTTGLHFSPNNKILASCAVDETIRLWDVHTGECLTTLKVKDPYEGMIIQDTRGIAPSTRQALKQLGAIEKIKTI